MARIIFLTLLYFISAYSAEQTTVFSDYNNDEIINRAAKRFKAEVGVSVKIQCKPSDHIYRHFDARKRWPNCKTIGEVHNQGYSLNSWAIAAIDAFADRMCVATNGKYDKALSAQELISCCKNCHSEDYGAIKAWEYFKSHGVVTGGNYNTTDGCQPYTCPPYLYPNSQAQTVCVNNKKCITQCYGDKTIDYKSDHVKTRDAYTLTYNSIQKDVQTFGPIAATFDLYDDLFNNRHKKGVYTRSRNAKYLGKHSAKLIGWGVKNGVDYWLLVNTVGYDWGEKGLFKIKRGTNECGIDNSTTGGVPNV